MKKALSMLLLTAAAVLLPAHHIACQKVPAGIAAGVDTILVKNVKNYLMPMILDVVNNVDIPRVDFDNGHVDNIKLNLHVQHNESIQLTFSQAANGGVLTTQDINGVVSAKCKYRMLFITVNADVKVTFDQGAITMVTELPLHTQMHNNRQLPRIDVQNFDLNFDSSKIHITLTGSVLADILDKIVWVFKNLIMKAISKVIDSEVPKAIQDAINDQIKDTNGIAPMFNDIAIDVQMPVDPHVTDHTIELYVNATIFDQKVGYKVPDTTISGLDIDFTQSNQMVVDASTYSVDSLLSVLQDQGLFKFTFDQTTFDGVAKDYLTTTMLDGFLPGIAAKYGKGQPVALRFHTAVAPNSFFKVGEVGAKMTATIEFVVNGETAVALSVTDADALISPTLDNFNLKIQVLKFTIREITITQSLIGDVNADELKVFLNVLFRMSIPFLNQFLEGGFRLPNEYFGILVVKQAEFHSMDGFIQISFVPEFI